MLKKRALERIVRSFGNHRRIDMLGLLKENPELSVSEVAHELKINMKTASEHMRRLTIAGLIMKRSQGKSIRHKLTLRGLNILTFLRTLE
jgi:DNA-binding transcriptional ArsR family regulator